MHVFLLDVLVEEQCRVVKVSSVVVYIPLYAILQDISVK